jgi:hypothetical protein
MTVECDDLEEFLTMTKEDKVTLAIVQVREDSKFDDYNHCYHLPRGRNSCDTIV